MQKCPHYDCRHCSVHIIFDWRGDSGNCASSSPRGPSGGAEGRSRAAAQTGKTRCHLPFGILAESKCPSLLPLWTGGCLFPLPSKPLPECDAQQPAENLRPWWSRSLLHSATPARPGERHDRQLKTQHRCIPANVNGSKRDFSPSIQEEMLPSSARSSGVLREPVSQMHLVFDEEEDEGQEGGKCAEGGEDPQASRDTTAGSSRGPDESAGNPAPRDSGWDSGGTPLICNNMVIREMKSGLGFAKCHTPLNSCKIQFCWIKPQHCLVKFWDIHIWLKTQSASDCIVLDSSCN